MAEFTVNPHRYDPYKNFKFLVVWEGRVVAGVSKVSALKRTTEVVKHRSGGDPSTPRLSAGRTEFDPITLERGVTHDFEFDRWANKVWAVGHQIVSELDANANAVAIQSLRVENEGWERDYEVPEPVEPIFTIPS
jgi:hypothetical protein